MSQVILQNKIQKDESTLSSLISRTITSITIPNGTTKIGAHVFDDCTALANVTIPNSVTEIGTYAFYKCAALTNVTIPNVVTEIGYRAFEKCTALANVTIPNSVTNVAESAFFGCSSLKSVTVLASSPPTLGYGVFSATSNNLVIYVPAESVDTYKAASGWSDYASRIQAIPS